MYYHKILRVWVLDVLDYFLISALIGSFVASYLKNYLSEKAAIKRLKNCMIDKSGLTVRKKPILESKKSKIKRIYRVALGNRGGQLEELQPDHELYFKVAEDIKEFVERLATFLKEKELQGMAKIFFKSGRLILELILRNSNIVLIYSFLDESSTQFIVATVTTGGAAGFALSWFSVGASLVVPPILISTLFLRSVTQQFLNQREYSKFKKMVEKMLDDDELEKTFQGFFIEGGVPTPIPEIREIKPLDFYGDSVLNCDFDLKSGEGFEEFIKARMKEELGLIENPSEIQLEKIIHRKVKRKLKGKTVFFRDFIDEIQDTDLLDIIDAKILE